MRAVLIEPIEEQRGRFERALTQSGFQVSAYAGWPPGLASDGEATLWLIADQGELTRNACAIIRQHPASALQALLPYGRGDSNQRSALVTAGADAYLPFPFSGAQLLREATRLYLARKPVSAFRCLPEALAALVDRLSFARAQRDPYGLLELSPGIDGEALRQRFRERSFLLHPDRHHQLKSTEPVVYERIQDLYKGCLEAYQTLSDPLGQRIHLIDRFESAPPGRRRLSERIRTASDHQGALCALFDAFISRDQGDWRGALKSLREARDQAPESERIAYFERVFLRVAQIADPSIQGGAQ